MSGIVEELRASTVQKLPNDWRKGRVCPECGSVADRPKCLFDMGPSCPRNDPDNYDPPPYVEEPEPLAQRAADTIERLRAELAEARVTITRLEAACSEHIAGRANAEVARGGLASDVRRKERLRERANSRAEAAEARASMLAGALEKCAERFDEYAVGHTHKNTMEGDIKARRNDAMADMCRAALQSLPARIKAHAAAVDAMEQIASEDIDPHEHSSGGRFWDQLSRWHELAKHVCVQAGMGTRDIYGKYRPSTARDRQEKGKNDAD